MSLRHGLAEPSCCQRSTAADDGWRHCDLSAGHTESVEAVQFCSQLPIVATGGVDGRLGLWNAATMASRNVCSHPEVRLCSELLHRLQELA